MNRFLLLAATVMLAMPAAAQTQAPAQGRGGPQGAAQAGSADQAVNAVRFAQRAALTNLFEIESSQLALQRTQNDQLRQYAQQLIQDHQQAQQRLIALVREIHDMAPRPQVGVMPQGGTAAGAAAGSMATGSSPSGAAPAAGGGAAGVGPFTLLPQQLDQEHQQMLRRLQQAQGAEFERLYLQMQVQAHQQAVELFRDFAQSGDNSALRQFAQQTVPVLQQHLQTAQQLQQGLRG